MSTLFGNIPDGGGHRFVGRQPARSVATAKGRRVGRPVLAAPDKIAYAVHLRGQGDTIAQIVAKTGIPRTSLYRHLPPRPAETLTADDAPAERDVDQASR